MSSTDRIIERANIVVKATEARLTSRSYSRQAPEPDMELSYIGTSLYTTWT